MSFKSTSDIGRLLRMALRIANRIGLAAVAVAAGLAVPAVPAGGPTEPGPALSTVAAARPDPATRDVSEARIRYPVAGSRRWRIAAGTGGVIGTRGRLLRFRVLVERNITNLDAGAVAAFVESTLADPRGWTA